MSRPSGFTDAELAAAAWRRNMKNKSGMAQEMEVGVVNALCVFRRWGGERGRGVDIKCFLDT